MTETQTICKWLEKQNYAITTAHSPDKTIIFFHKHGIEKQAIYAIVKYENDNSFHIGNLFVKNKTLPNSFISHSGGVFSINITQVCTNPSLLLAHLIKISV